VLKTIKIELYFSNGRNWQSFSFNRYEKQRC